MKLILLTSPDFFVEEDKILTSLFEEGLDLLYLRKPNHEPVYSERLLTLLPQQYHNRIMVYDHFYLKEEFDLFGIHLSKYCPNAPKDYEGHISRSCYDLENIKEDRKGVDFVMLSHVFDSLSDKGVKGIYTTDQLKSAAREGIIDRKVMAMGGVTLDNLSVVRDCGFGGAVVRGELWNRFNIHQGADFKGLLNHFRKLRKASE